MSYTATVSEYFGIKKTFETYEEAELWFIENHPVPTLNDMERSIREAKEES